MDGTDASTTFTDSAAGGGAPHTMTANGNAQIDTAQSKFGGAAGLFDGTGDFLTTPDSADFAFGSGNLTIDFWLRVNSFENEAGFVSHSNTAGGSQDASNSFELRFDSTTYANLQFGIWSGGTNIISIIAAHGMVVNTWYHIALIRGWNGNANDFAITVDGTAIGTVTDADTWPDFTNDFVVGMSQRAGNRYFNGWIDELRVSKGVARWTANFTPPVAAYS